MPAPSRRPGSLTPLHLVEHPEPLDLDLDTVGLPEEGPITRWIVYLVIALGIFLALSFCRGPG